MTALVGGTTAFANLDKALVVSVDGTEKQVHSFAKTVGDVLEHQGIEVGPHDTVAPGRGSQISDGTRIAVRYGRLVRVTVDGERREAWVTAITVEEALEQLGVRDQRAFVSVSRSAPIGRQGLAFDIRLPHRVTIDVEGKRHAVATTAATVAEAIAAAGIDLTRKDLVFPARDVYPQDGDVIKVFKILGKVVTRTEAIPYETRQVKSADVYVGDIEVGQAGRDGEKRITYEVVRKDGAWVTRRTLFTDVVKEPVDRIIWIGATPYPLTGVEDLNWAALAECESGGNPRAVSANGHYGLYQFSLATWQSVGGSGNPIDASPDEQTYRAQLLYNRAGAGQWSCGSHLFD